MWSALLYLQIFQAVIFEFLREKVKIYFHIAVYNFVDMQITFTLQSSNK